MTDAEQKAREIVDNCESWIVAFGSEPGLPARPKQLENLIIKAICEAEAAAYESAAQVAATDALHEIAGERSDWAQGYREARRSIATAIRQLKDK